MIKRIWAGRGRRLGYLRSVCEEDVCCLIGWREKSNVDSVIDHTRQAFEELEKLLSKYNICIAVRERLVKDSGVAGDAAYNGLVLKINSKPKAKGVIIFGSDQEVSSVMRAVRRNNLTANFNWIGSDGWAGRLLVSEGNEPEVEGTLAFLPQAHPVKGFDNYFVGLTPLNNRRNPWFIGEFTGKLFLPFFHHLLLSFFERILGTPFPVPLPFQLADSLQFGASLRRLLYFKFLHFSPLWTATDSGVADDVHGERETDSRWN